MVKQIATTLIILSITLLADKNETSSDSTSFKEIMKIANTTFLKLLELKAFHFSDALQQTFLSLSSSSQINLTILK